MTMILNCQLCGRRFYANTEHVCPSDDSRIVELLEKILDRMPAPEGAKDEPSPADDGLTDWERELFRPATCCGKCPPIVGGGYDCTCEGNPRCAKADTPKEWHVEPTPADDLPGEPGEPVEPGDLRVGDKVSFTWKGTGERITCNLVRHPNYDSALRSDVPDWGDFIPNVVYLGEWDSGISDVRLIERAPREDEALEKALEKAWLADDCFNGSDVNFHTLARAAREHFHANEGYGHDLLMRDRNMQAYHAKKAKAERDEWKARHEALRADVREYRDTFASHAAERVMAQRLLARDDERAKG